MQTKGQHALINFSEMQLAVANNVQPTKCNLVHAIKWIHSRLVVTLNSLNFRLLNESGNTVFQPQQKSAAYRWGSTQRKG